MKMEGGGGVATSSGATLLHKIKVKEEAKECCPSVLPQQTGGGPSSESSPPRGVPGVAIGAIATITISSGCGGELAAAVAAKQNAQAADAFPVDLDLKSRTRGEYRTVDPLCILQSRAIAGSVVEQSVALPHRAKGSPSFLFIFIWGQRGAEESAFAFYAPLRIFSFYTLINRSTLRGPEYVV